MNVTFEETSPNSLRILVKDGGLIPTRRGIRQGFFKMGRDFKRTVDNEVLRTQKLGRVYKIRTPSGRRRRHRASAPFQSHANLSGALRKSSDFKIQGMESMEVGYLKGDAPNYAGYVEEGTKNMDPRPTIRNSLKKNLVTGRQHIQREIEKAFDESR